MKAVKKILKGLFWFLVIANVAIVVTGNTHMYKGLVNTYLVGVSGPQIDEQDIFANRPIKMGTPSPWPKHSNYNTGAIGQANLQELEQLQTVSFLVFQNGELLFENYWEDFDKRSITNSFSMAKTVVSILLGIAIEEGKISSLDQKVGDFLPSFSEGKKANITLKHLVTMSSGLNWTESGANPFSDNAKGYYGSDLQGLIDDLEVIGEPGMEFIYLSGNTQILGFVLEKATGKKLSDYASEKLWQPLGAESDALWNLDSEGGMEKAFCCLYATSRDYARIGQLYLQGGKWNGQQIISEAYVTTSIQPADLFDVKNNKDNARYGYSWWLDTYKGMDIFYARGINGQYIIVIPEKNSVIVRAGRKRAEKNPNEHPSDFYTMVDAALEIL